MKYIREDVEKMLEEHKNNKAKLKEIKMKEEEYQERLEYAGTVYEETKEEAIERMQLSGTGYDIIPAKTNKATDKTYNTMINYQKEQRHINKENREYLERKLKEFEKEENILKKKIMRVENLLDATTIEEKFVIELYYLDDAKWDYVEKEYFTEFEKHKSIKQLQSYRDEALQKMLNILNVGL